MEDEHREAIRRNISSLVNQTDLERMRSALNEKGIFTEHNIETYNDSSSTQMHRKRCMYNDIMRRGPRAFDVLLETLEENGYWDLVRMLDPNSILNTFSTNLRTSIQSSNNYVSISENNNLTRELSNSHQKTVTENEVGATAANNNSQVHFDVKKSEKMVNPNQNSDIGIYPRREQRGILLLFTYNKFKYNVEPYRAGADLDSDNLKHLFSEMGFRILRYLNLELQETRATLSNLRDVLDPALGCVFIMVSSHGHERAGSGDTDIRCHDGKLISCNEIILYFSNTNLPLMSDVPKVFVFQTCRGAMEEYAITASPPAALLREPERDGTAIEPDARASATTSTGRYIPPISNVLVVQSTLPGFVSRRDPERGSWYIQALCEVFAARAHDCDVDTLFTLVDEKLRERFHIQTSSVDRWGFNRKLYLYPGLPLTLPE